MVKLYRRRRGGRVNRKKNKSQLNVRAHTVHLNNRAIVNRVNELLLHCLLFVIIRSTISSFSENFQIESHFWMSKHFNIIFYICLKLDSMKFKFKFRFYLFIYLLIVFSCLYSSCRIECDRE